MSNEKQKDIASLLAEMRHGLDKSWHDIDREWVHDLPDRFDAAWKRQEQVYLDQIRDLMNMLGHERYVAEHMKKPTVGNAADMREALVKTLDKLQEVTVAEEYDALLMDDCVRYIRKALAAPPRNCDVYKTSWDVVTRWDGGLDSTQSIVRMLDWLLAPVKFETKGETK